MRDAGFAMRGSGFVAGDGKRDLGFVIGDA